MKTVLLLVSEKHELDKYKHKIDHLYELNIKSVIASAIYYMLVSTFLINTCVQSGLLLLGSRFVQNGEMQADVLLAFMFFVCISQSLLL